MADSPSSTDGAGRVTLVRRGERVGSDHPEYVWWQELPEDVNPEALRQVGYEVVEFVRASAERERTRVLEEALEEIKALPGGEHVGTGRNRIYKLNGHERAVAIASASLAAVAVEDEGKATDYETSSARPVPAAQGADAGGILGHIPSPSDDYTGPCPCGCGVRFVDGVQLEGEALAWAVADEYEANLRRVRAAALSDADLQRPAIQGLRDFLLRETDSAAGDLEAAPGASYARISNPSGNNPHPPEPESAATEAAEPPTCCCGNGEAEEDRSAVLRCPVHGPGYETRSARSVPAGATLDALKVALYLRGACEAGVDAVVAFVTDPLPGWRVIAPSEPKATGTEAAEPPLNPEETS